MEYKKVSNELGLECEIVSANSCDYNPIFGGDSSNPSWEEYLAEYNDEYKPHVLLLRKCIEENGLIGETGQFADDLAFKFSDGQIWGFTWRAWGDLMQAIVNKREGYMAYYM